MKSLIYLCSFGAPSFKGMTELCVSSLRYPGRYTGRIVVFTNNGYESRDPGVEVVPIPEDLDTFEIFAFKARAPRYIAGAGYDKIVCMDADMIAIKDVNPLFAYSDDSACAMEERPWTRMSDRPCGASLAPAERKAARRRWGVNTGLLCTPGSLFSEYMRLWFEEITTWRKNGGPWKNQPPWNALIWRRQVRFKAFPREWIDMPPMYYWFGDRLRVMPETRILHFCWPEKEHALKEMEVFLEVLTGT